MKDRTANTTSMTVTLTLVKMEALAVTLIRHLLLCCLSLLVTVLLIQSVSATLILLIFLNPCILLSNNCYITKSSQCHYIILSLTGDTCLDAVDICQPGSNPCNTDHSRCIDLYRDYKCECDQGYYGKNCTVSSFSKC